MKTKPDLKDYLYYNSDCFDTNYHLRSQVVTDNPRRWLRDDERAGFMEGIKVGIRLEEELTE